MEISFFRDLKNIDQGHAKVKGHGQGMKKIRLWLHATRWLFCFLCRILCAKTDGVTSSGGFLVIIFSITLLFVSDFVGPDRALGVALGLPVCMRCTECLPVTCNLYTSTTAGIRLPKNLGMRKKIL